MKKSLVVIALSSCFLFACDNSTESASTESTTPSDASIQNTMPAQPEAPVQNTSTDNSGAATMQAVPVATPEAPTQMAAPTAKGMNPAHGEPGHRCEIAVGAPLNSAPAATNSGAITPSASPVVPSATPSSPPATSAPTTTAPGMNPPHGEPGHDCSVAVGAPLKK